MVKRRQNLVSEWHADSDRDYYDQFDVDADEEPETWASRTQEELTELFPDFDIEVRGYHEGAGAQCRQCGQLFNFETECRKSGAWRLYKALNAHRAAHSGVVRRTA